MAALKGGAFLKRQAIVLVLAFLISLFGCSQKIKPQEAVLGGFECNFILNIGQTEYKGSAKIKADNLQEFSFTSPQDISGLNIKLENSGYTASLGDITYNGNLNELPSNNPFTKLHYIFSLNYSGEDLKSDSEGYYTESKNSGYKIYYRADGFPQKIIFTDTKNQIEFSDISYLF